MGINKLFENLCSNDCISLLDVKDVKNNFIFIDVSSVYYKYMHVSCNMNELFDNVIEHIRSINSSNIYLFCDEGNIPIKSDIRNIRETNLNNQRNRIKAGFTNKTNYNIEDVTNEDIDRIITDPELASLYKRRKFGYFDIKDKKTVIRNLCDEIARVINNVIIEYANNIDAEFYIIERAIDFNKEKNTWPILYSDDQDILLYSAFLNAETITIFYRNNYYNIKINSLTRSISILNLIFNKSDYCKGIKGMLLDNKKKYTNINTMNDKITKRNIYELCYNFIMSNRYSKFVNQNVIIPNEVSNSIDNYINYIMLIISLDRKFYDITSNDYICHKNFINYIFRLYQL